MADTGSRPAARRRPYFVAIAADGNVVARASGELEAPQIDALLDAARGG